MYKVVQTTSKVSKKIQVMGLDVGKNPKKEEHNHECHVHNFSKNTPKSCRTQNELNRAKTKSKCLIYCLLSVQRKRKEMKPSSLYLMMQEK